MCGCMVGDRDTHDQFFHDAPQDTELRTQMIVTGFLSDVDMEWLEDFTAYLSHKNPALSPPELVMLALTMKIRGDVVV